MAERRMFSKKIIDSDAFLDMPQSTQCLYFHLGMRADDDGFINGPKKIARMVGSSDKDLEILVEKRYLLAFDSGVVVIKHWKIHNYIQNDRYKPTLYMDEANSLHIKENGVYTELTDPVSIMDTTCTPRLGKDRLGKDRLDKDRKEGVHHKVVADNPPTLDELQAYAKERCPSVNPLAFSEYYTGQDWVDKNGKPVRNWKLKMITWHENEVKRGWKPASSYADPVCPGCGKPMPAGFCKNRECPDVIAYLEGGES